MTLLLHLIFFASAVVYIVGNVLDHNNSLGRGEQNRDYQDARGYFDSAKFKKANIRTFIICMVASLVGEFALSFGTPHYAYLLLIGIGTFLFIGIRGMILSRR